MTCTVLNDSRENKFLFCLACTFAVSSRSCGQHWGDILPGSSVPALRGTGTLAALPPGARGEGHREAPEWPLADPQG